MKKVVTLALATVLGIVSYAQSKTWNVDQSHSKVNFSVSHLMISEVDGIFSTFNGNITSESNDFSNAKIYFEIDINSINTGNSKRDAHLKSEDFFSVKKYSKMIFKSTSFKKKKGNKYTLKGNLTMRGITKQVELEVKYGGTAVDGYGNTRAGFVIAGIINRIDYGVAWNAKTKEGGWTVGEDVNLTIKLELIKDK